MSIFALEEVVAVGSSTVITDCAAFCDGKRWCLATAADGDDGACRFYTDKTRLGLAAAGDDNDDDLCSASVNFGCRLSTGKRDGVLLDLDGHVFQVATEGLGSHDDGSGACRVSTADDKYRPDDFVTLELHTRYFAGAAGSVDVWAEKMEAAHDGHEDVRRRLNEHVEVGFFDHAVSASLGAGYPITAARKAVREFTTEDWYDRRHDPLHKRIAQAFYRFRYNTWHGQCLVTDDRFFYITTTMNSELRYLNCPSLGGGACRFEVAPDTMWSRNAFLTRTRIRSLPFKVDAGSGAGITAAGFLPSAHIDSADAGLHLTDSASTCGATQWRFTRG